MTKIDWEVVTNYIESVGTIDTVFPFNKPQNLVKVTNGGGNGNLIYTIGSQTGTLTPGQSVTVTETISNITLRASTGKQAFQVWASEAGTEKDETDTSYQGQIDSLTSSLAQKSAYTNFSDLLISGQITSIKLIGDSITWGAKSTNYSSGNSGRLIYGSNYEQSHSVNCWANLMRNAINALYPSIDVFNAGINGYAMSDLSQNKAAWFGINQDAVIITLGVNDLAKSTSIAQFESYMEDVITYGLANCNHLYFATTPPLNKTTPIQSNGFSAEMLNQSIRKKCQAHNIPCLDINTHAIQLCVNSRLAFKTGAYYYNDDTHPSDAGHAILWKAYQNALGFKNNQVDFMNDVNSGSLSKIMYASDFPAGFTINDLPTNQTTVYGTNSIIYVPVGTSDLTNFSPNGLTGTLVITNPNAIYSTNGYVTQQYYADNGDYMERVFKSNRTWSNWATKSPKEISTSFATGIIAPNNYVKIATITIKQQFYGFYGTFFLKAAPGNSLLNSTAMLDVVINQSAAMGSDAAKTLQIITTNNGGTSVDFYKTSFVARTRTLDSTQTIIDIYIKNTNTGNRNYGVMFLGGVNTAGTEATFTIGNDLTSRTTLDTQSAGTTDVNGVFNQSLYVGSPDGSLWSLKVDNTGVVSATKIVS